MNGESGRSGTGAGGSEGKGIVQGHLRQYHPGNGWAGDHELLLVGKRKADDLKGSRTRVRDVQSLVHGLTKIDGFEIETGRGKSDRPFRSRGRGMVFRATRKQK